MESAWSTAHAVKHDVRRLGGLFMKSRIAQRHAAELGLPGYAYYFGGRGSVLGDVSAETVESVFVIFPAELVREEWPRARAAASPEEFLERYLRTCRAWGREHLAGLEGAERLAELMSRIVESPSAAASAPLMPLFAGWRRVPLPDDPPALVAQLAHVLREHRGGMHLRAVASTGIRPLEAIVTREDGERRAAVLAWKPPYPRVDKAMLRRREETETLTDDLTAPAYAVLDDDERAELRVLLDRAHRLARS